VREGSRVEEPSHSTFESGLDMFNTIVWALLTGLITGVVGMGIVVWQHQRRMMAYRPELLHELEQRLGEFESMQDRLAALEDVADRLAEVEERLDFAERMLTKPRSTEGSAS
jgi:hypothetical protein